MQSHPAVFRCLCAAPVALALWTLANIGQSADETAPDPSTPRSAAEPELEGPALGPQSPTALQPALSSPRPNSAPGPDDMPRFPGQLAPGGRPSALTPGGFPPQPTRLPRTEATLTSLPQTIDNRQAGQLVFYVRKEQDRVEMVVHTSLVLSMDQNIPKLQVDNPELLKVLPLSANQVQIHAEKTGVTYVRLWDERNQLFTVEVSIRADGKELSALLKAQFPGARVAVNPTTAGVILSGTVDHPEDVRNIVALAQDYYPKVVNNLRIGGTPQVILHVKVMEVSRTKLRQLGVDFTDVFNNGNSFISSTAAGVGRLTGFPQVVGAGTTAVTTTVGAGGNAPTVALGLVDSSSGFFLFISALQKNSLLKVLAEPTLVTVSGRPAYFLSGGELPIPIPQSLGTISIQFRKFGTQVDFVPIVLGNGRIRLEVRPKISEIDPTIGTTLNNTTVPGFRTREVDTGVEMMAGQTLALAGLIQTEVQSSVQGIPYLMDIPYLGVPFRYTTDTVNEVELLIMVRPELAEPLDCDQVPPGGPGTGTTVPDNCGLYFHGYMEVPVNGDQLQPIQPYMPGWPQQNMVPVPQSMGSPTQGEMVPPGPQQPDQAPAPSAMWQSQPTPAGSDRRIYSDMTAGPSGDARGYTARAPGNRMAAGMNNRSNQQVRQIAPRTNADSELPMFIGPTGYDLNK